MSEEQLQVITGIPGPAGSPGVPGPPGSPGGPPGPQGKPGGVYVGPTVPNISDDEMLPLWVDISELEGVVTEGLPRRSDTTFEITLGALASGDHDAVIAPGYRLLRIATDQPARVRVYYSSPARTADAARNIGVDPVAPHGLLAEVVTVPDALEVWLNPSVHCYTTDATASVPLSIANTQDSAQTIQVTLTLVPTERTAEGEGSPT